MSPYKKLYPDICYFRFWESKRSSDFKRNRRMSPALFWFKAPRTVVSSQLCIPNFLLYSGRASLALARSTTAAARSAQNQSLLSWPGLLYYCCCKVTAAGFGAASGATTWEFSGHFRPMSNRIGHSWVEPQTNSEAHDIDVERAWGAADFSKFAVPVHPWHTLPY